jgi:transposase, IS5 family
MIRTSSSKQLTIAEFDWPFETALDKNNRWVKLSQCIPWDELAESYYQGLSSERGRPAKDARLVIGAVIIKHKLCLSDVETVQQIQENPYLQFFVGLPGYQQAEPFAPSLFVDIRKRMGIEVFDAFHRSVVDAHEGNKKKCPTGLPQQPPSQAPASEAEEAPATPQAEAAVQSEEPTHQGKLIVDATVVGQAIRYPTDLSLLNEARQFSERIIDTLCANLKSDHKPRTYRRKARHAYLAVAKQKRPGSKTLRRGCKQQLQYLRRNLGHIGQLLAPIPEGSPLPLPAWLLYRYWVIQHLYQQQWDMYQTKAHRCDHRIVSISQPYVRPIVRGKQDKPVEFGAKLSVSLTADGLAHVDHLRWDAFHEGLDLESQVEAYRDRHGYYPERVLADTLYGTRANREYLKQRGIHFAGKPIGRPKQETDENREQLIQLKVQRRQDYLQRIHIEGKFGQGKNGYRLNYIRAKRADTSFAWINSIFLVMNLLILQRIFLCRWKIGFTGIMMLLEQTRKRIIRNLCSQFMLNIHSVNFFG